MNRANFTPVERPDGLIVQFARARREQDFLRLE
jgi:hypothetical protein